MSSSSPASTPSSASAKLDAAPAPPAYLARQPRCPQCQSYVYRVPRRWRDLLLSVWWPRRRYSCRSFGCGWEACLRVDEGRTDAGGAGQAGASSESEQRSYRL